MDENIPIDYAKIQSSYSSEDMFIFLSQIGFVKPTEKEINYCPIDEPSTLFNYLIAFTS